MIKKQHIILILLLGLLAILIVPNFFKKEKSPLSVAAAANLTQVFSEMGTTFTKETGIPIEFIFGSTGQLTQQIKNGAPVDLFAAADRNSIKILAEEGIIDRDTIKDYAMGNLVLVPYGKAQYEAKTLNDLKNPQIKIIALANPKTAPYGKAAQELLITAGLWEDIKRKIVFGQNIDEVLTYVKTGNADAAFLAKSLVYSKDIKYYEDKKWLNLYQPIIQTMGVIKECKNKEAALEFSQFILSTEGQKIMKKHGYDLP